MRRFFQLSSLQRREKGVALIIALSIMAMLLIIAMSFAFTARTDRAASANHASNIKARLIAESGLNQLVAFVQNELSEMPLNSTVVPTNFAYPPQYFFPTAFHPAFGDWDERPMLFSVDSPDEHGTKGDSVDKAMHVSIAGFDFTPSSNTALNADSHVAWTNVLVNSPISDSVIANTDSSIVGRYVYVILDESGKIDPGAVVPDTSVRTGASLNEIRLAAASDDETRDFLQSPGHARWHSWMHLFRAGNTAGENGDFSDSHAQIRHLAKVFFPHAAPDPEQYWLDTDGDDSIAASELIDRIDITTITSDSAPQIYDALLGGAAGRVQDDSKLYSQWAWRIDWTKRIDLPDTTWANAIEEAQEIRYQAAKVAANIVAYAGGSTAPHYIAQSDNSLTRSLPTPYTYRIYPAHNTYGLGELFAVIQVERKINTEIEVTPRFRVEVFAPFLPAPATAVATVELDYGYTLGGDISDSAVATINIPLDKSTTVYGRTLLSNQNLADGPVSTLTVSPPPKDVILIDFYIDGVRFYDSTGTLMRELPDRNLPTGSRMYSAENVGATERLQQDEQGMLNFRMNREVIDPMNDGYHQGSAVFTKYVWGSGASEGDDLLKGLGTTEALPYVASHTTVSDKVKWDYASNPYGDAAVKGSAYARVGEIGRVTGWMPGESLRLWSGDAADITTHDGYLIDMFKVGTKTSTRGKINLNSRQHAVLRALFHGTGGTGVYNDSEAARAVITYQTNKASPITNIGEIASVVGIGHADTANDREAELRIEQIAELITTRQNAYTVIITAQALRDLNEVQTANSLPWADGPRFGKRHATLLGEHKIMAVLQHDAYLNTIKVVRIDYLHE